MDSDMQPPLSRKSIASALQLSLRYHFFHDLFWCVGVHVPDRDNHEDCIPKRIQDVECSCTPRFILRRAKHIELLTPLLKVCIGIIYLERHTGVATVSIHRAVQGDLDRTTSQSQKPHLTIVRSLK